MSTIAGNIAFTGKRSDIPTTLEPKLKKHPIRFSDPFLHIPDHTAANQGLVTGSPPVTRYAS